jgi:hypothetical protein
VDGTPAMADVLDAMRQDGAVSAFWTQHLDADDRALMLAELRDCLGTLESTGDPGPLETCLREWRVTAEALADPERRAVLTGPLEPGDFTEVARP